MLITRREVKVEWGECDPADIVFYPNYFIWFDASVMEHFESVGLPKKELLKRYNLNGWPMIDTRARFHKPSSYGDIVTIETCIPKWGRTSFEIEHKLFNKGELAVEGFEKRVLVGRDPETGKLKSVPVPAEVIELFGTSE
ncbi:MAG: acyl-CoA thioesterase [Hyphomicrobiaceae bacterium]